MTDTDGIEPPLELLGAGRNDQAQNNEFYVLAVDFADAAAYETISYTYVDEQNNNGRGRHHGVVLVSDPTDTTAPAAVTWETVPTGTFEDTITMTAAETTDPEGAPVSYRFTNVTLGHDSGWQQSRTWDDTGLAPSTAYDYIVEARDNTPNENTTAPSTQEQGTTTTTDGTPPPVPSFAVAPTPHFPNEANEITMTADTVVDPEGAGVEYYFTCTQGTANGGDDSGWQASPAYVDDGLDPETTYEYTVMARDTSSSLNESGQSATSSTVTMGLPTGTFTDSGLSSFFLFGTSDFDVSVYPSNNGFRCADKSINETFGVNVGDSIQGYSFITKVGSEIQSYASDVGDSITYGPYVLSPEFVTREDPQNLWTGTDPGSPDWVTTADHTTNTGVGTFYSLQASVDISGMTSGSVYFFYAAYRATPYFDLALKDSDGLVSSTTIVGVGDEDAAQGEEWYCKRIDFSDAADYESLEVFFSSSLYNGNPNCRFAGIVLVGQGGGGDDFATWIGGYDLGILTGFNDDADADGNDNGVEAWFGTNPSVGGSGLTQVSQSGSVFTFHHPEADPAITDVSGSYEWSLDFSSWHAPGTVGDTTVSITATPNDPVAGTTKVEADTVGSAVAPTTLFLRAVATQN